MSLSSTTPLTPEAAEFVECMAQEQVRYETIGPEQREIMIEDQPSFEAALAQFQQSPLAATPGQAWLPAPDKVDEYLANCEVQCDIVPQNFDELSLP